MSYDYRSAAVKVETKDLQSLTPEEAATLKELSHGPSGRMHEHLTSGGKKRVFLVKEAGQVWAWSIIASYGVAVDLDVFVDPKHRGKGLASKACRAAIQYAKKLKATKVTAVASDGPSAALYKSLGFGSPDRFGQMVLKV